MPNLALLISDIRALGAQHS